MPVSYLMLGAQGQQVAGDSTGAAHKGWIELTSVSLPGARSTYGGGSGGVTKVDLHQVSLSKITDSSSPTLFAACADGRRFEAAVIDMLDGKMQVVLSDVFVTSFQVSADANTNSESVTLSFGSAKQTYTGTGP